MPGACGEGARELSQWQSWHDIELSPVRGRRSSDEDESMLNRGVSLGHFLSFLT